VCGGDFYGSSIQFRRLVFLGLDKIPEDRFFAQCLARLEAVQTVHEDEAFAIASDQNRGRLPDLEHALRNLLHSLWSKRRTALYRDINARYR
jgi:hypothetical protein